jgi:glucose-1-phosphate thymidylyltransferase
MKLIVPLAGFGSRMRPQTWTKPKPLINVAGKPFLGHLLDKFAGLDIDELVIIYGWLGDQIKAYLQADYGHLKTRFVEQGERKGQSHALWLAREHLHGDGIVIWVDTFFDTDLSVLKAPVGDGIAFIKEVDDPRRFGVVELDEAGYATRFIEKPTSVENKKVIIGFYWIQDLEWLVRCIEKQMTTGRTFKGEYYLSEALQVMIEDGAKFRVCSVDVWQDTGKPETTLQTNRYLLDHGCDNSASVSTVGGAIVPPVYVAPDAVIEHAVVGPYANVGSGATIRHAIVTNSIVEAKAVVEGILLEGSLIGEQAQVRGQPTHLHIGHSAAVGLEFKMDESWT